jgi:hypothetical protein
MLDDDLTAPLEQLGEAHAAVWRIEAVLLLYLHPGQVTSRCCNLILLASQLLLFDKQLTARGDPLLFRYDGWVNEVRSIIVCS